MRSKSSAVYGVKPEPVFGSWRPSAIWEFYRLSMSSFRFDSAGVSDTVSHMKISTRSLVREFPKAKAAARKGQAVEIVDGKTGERFVLTAKPTKTFGEIAARARGVYAGPRDLSTREGFGG